MRLTIEINDHYNSENCSPSMYHLIIWGDGRCLMNDTHSSLSSAKFAIKKFLEEEIDQNTINLGRFLSNSKEIAEAREPSKCSACLAYESWYEWRCGRPPEDYRDCSACKAIAGRRIGG